MGFTASCERWHQAQRQAKAPTMGKSHMSTEDETTMHQFGLPLEEVLLMLALNRHSLGIRILGMLEAL